jgi:hypothetical protein
LRLRFFDAPAKFRDNVLGGLSARGANYVRKSAVRLARGAAYNSIESACRRVELSDIATPQKIRTTHHAKALLLECQVKQPDAREKG